MSCQIFVLPSTGFELTPLIHCCTIRLALRPAPLTTRPHPLPIYTKMTDKTISNLKIGFQIQPENSKTRIEIPLVHIHMTTHFPGLLQALQTGSVGS